MFASPHKHRGTAVCDKPSNRWITVAPVGQTDMEIVLQPPEWGTGGDIVSREAQIGKYPGFVLASSDCHQVYEDLSAKGVHFISPPEDLPWGVSALFADKYG
jgi:hypothetical protein